MTLLLRNGDAARRKHASRRAARSPSGHAILHALRLIFDSMKLTEQFVAEYRFAKVAERMREIRLS
jgi:hypothetical protein